MRHAGRSSFAKEREIAIEPPSPRVLEEPLLRQLEYARALFDRDRKEGVPGVYLPNALERKYPSASTE